MSVNIHTSMPDYYGETKVAERLNAALDSDAHVWYNQHSPNGYEIDILLAAPTLGAFCVEVKAVSLDQISEYTGDKCTIQGRHTTHTPLKQARFAMLKLTDRVRDALGDSKEIPWFVATAAFPLISKAEFREKFVPKNSTNIDVEAHLDGMLFKEDLLSDDAVLAKLKHIYKFPPVGTGGRLYGVETKIENLVAALGRPVPTPAPELQQFTVKAGRPRKDSIKQFIEPGNRGCIAINGLPGSGKTQALLDIAASHADAGRFVLFVCFNKVLATKLRTDLEGLGLEPHVKDRIMVSDIYALKKMHEDKSSPIHDIEGFFKTVCVDEAQDLATSSGDLLEVVDNVVASDAEWFFAVGRDQELYGTAPQRVVDTAANPEKVQSLLRPSHKHTNGFRESNLAQIAFDYKFNPERAEKAGKELYERLAKHPEFMENAYTNAQAQCTVTEVATKNRVGLYKKIIQEELDRLVELGAELDLMILTPRKDRKTKDGVEEYLENRYIRQALDELGVNYHDQVKDENRRMQLPEDHVRFVTVHSSRGLQATRVLLFAPHALKDFGTEEITNSASYIAMSRALNGTRVIAVKDEEASRFEKFIAHTHASFQARVVEELPTRNMSQMIKVWQANGYPESGEKLKAREMNHRLKEAKLLSLDADGNWAPTEHGERIGIEGYQSEDKNGRRFKGVRYSKEAQDALLDLLKRGIF